MNITIKNIGWNIGTVGWLKKEFDNNNLSVREGVSKSGKHALYLVHKNKDGKKDSMCIAIYNPYDLNTEEFEKAEKYDVMEFSGGTYPGSTANIYCLTPSAIQTVQKIAQAWCNKKNQERSEDKELTVNVTFA